MGRRVSSHSQQDKLERITRLQTAIASLETYKNFFEHQGELAPEDVWVARYQVSRANIRDCYSRISFFFFPKWDAPEIGSFPEISSTEVSSIKIPLSSHIKP